MTKRHHHIVHSMEDEEYYRKYRTKYDLSAFTDWCCEECAHYWYPNANKDEKKGRKTRFCIETGKTKLIPKDLEVKTNCPDWCPFREEGA